MHSNRPLESNLLLTASQAADSLAISPRKLWGMTTSGEIPHIRLGRCVWYPVADLQRWIDQQKQEANHDPSNT